MAEGNWHNDSNLGWRVVGCLWVLAVRWGAVWRLRHRLLQWQALGDTASSSCLTVTFALHKDPREAIRGAGERGNNFTCQVGKWAALGVCVNTCVCVWERSRNEWNREAWQGLSRLWLEVGKELFPNPQDLFLELVGRWEAKLAGFTLQGFHLL